MRNKLTEQYDSLYASADVIFGEGKPVAAVTRLKNYLPEGTVLDIGGGEGRNTLYLAREGFKVTVTDLSVVGINKLQKIAEAEGLEICTLVEDTVLEGIKGVYDSVLATFVLHHIDANEVKKLIADARSHTSEGGINIIVTFANNGGLYERNVGKDTNRFYPDEKAMQELYTDWNILELTTHQTTTYAKDKQGNRMVNDVVTLVAQKPTV